MEATFVEAVVDQLSFRRYKKSTRIDQRRIPISSEPRSIFVAYHAIPNLERGRVCET
jgi:hypothetical protein